MADIIQLITIYALPLIFAITLPEAMRGYAAWYCGDETPRAAGRLSLNPAAHIDPFGTIVVPLFFLAGSAWLGAGAGFIFGWPKLVPIDLSKTRRPKRDLRTIALAGPGANVAMAIGWAVLCKLFLMAGLTSEDFFTKVAVAGILVNSFFAVMAMLPIPPMDGGRILISILPDHLAMALARVEPYGFIILLVLLASGLLQKLIVPLVRLLVLLLTTTLGI